MGDYTTDRVLGSTGKTYNAVFTDKTDNATLSQDDFLKLMITELTNQDFNNTMDTNQMVNQMTQFSNMQAMNEMLSYSRTNYAMSLVGKTVTASRYTVSGDLDTTTGKIDKVSLVDDEYVFYIGSNFFTHINTILVCIIRFIILLLIVECSLSVRELLTCHIELSH